MFQLKTTDAGTVTLHHIAGQRDDFADSLCHAVWPFRPGQKSNPGIVAVQMPEPFAPTTPRPFMRPQPGIRPTCEACGQSIEPGDPYVGAEAPRHARCTPKE